MGFLTLQNCKNNQKTLISAKDEESGQNGEPPQITVLPVMAAGSNNNNFSAESPISISEFSDEDSIAGNGNLAIKQVVRKRAPIFPFEPEDHYVPDNNSNNIIPKVIFLKYEILIISLWKCLEFSTH